MLAISIKQPWTDLLVRGAKSIEVRTWLPPSKLIGEVVAIHAGKEHDGNAPEWARLAGAQTHAILRLGGIIGTAKLVDFFHFSKDEWNEFQAFHLNPLNWWTPGLCGWEFSEPIRFERIIPCKGQLRFWELDEVIEGRVKAASL